jgi:hypothetical protein
MLHPFGATNTLCIHMRADQKAELTHTYLRMPLTATPERCPETFPTRWSSSQGKQPSRRFWRMVLVVSIR